MGICAQVLPLGTPFGEKPPSRHLYRDELGVGALSPHPWVPPGLRGHHGVSPSPRVTAETPYPHCTHGCRSPSRVLLSSQLLKLFLLKTTIYFKPQSGKGQGRAPSFAQHPASSRPQGKHFLEKQGEDKSTQEQNDSTTAARSRGRDGRGAGGTAAPPSPPQGPLHPVLEPSRLLPGGHRERQGERTVTWGPSPASWGIFCSGGTRTGQGEQLPSP